MHLSVYFLLISPNDEADSLNLPEEQGDSLLTTELRLFSNSSRFSTERAQVVRLKLAGRAHVNQAEHGKAVPVKLKS